MGKTGKIVAAVVLAFALVGGGVWLFTNERATAPAKKQLSETEDSKFPGAVDIVYTGFGFTPDDIALSPPATVNMINESTRDLDLASDPYPTRVNNPELNVGRIAPGKTKSFQVTKVGLWGYHNFLEPTQHGRVTVFPGE